MSYENRSQNKKVSLPHNTQLRHLFKSLKALAFGMVVAGIVLVVMIGYMNLTPALELTILLFFGLAGSLYLIARGKSILLQHQAAEDRYQKSQENQESQEKRFQSSMTHDE